MKEQILVVQRMQDYIEKNKKDADVLGYIEKCYRIFHCEDDEVILEDITEFLEGKGIAINACFEKNFNHDGTRRSILIDKVDTFFFQAPAFYKNHGYQEAFVLKKYPYTGKRYYYTKE